MTWTLPDQHDRLAIVTGANSGLGLQIATQLAGAGAEVVLACRNVEKAEAAVVGIRAGQPDAGVQVRPWTSLIWPAFRLSARRSWRKGTTSIC